MNDDVTIPTGGEWKQIPGSPFEIVTYPHEQVGTLHLRYNEEYATVWFEEMLDKCEDRLRWLVGQ